MASDRDRDVPNVIPARINTPLQVIEILNGTSEPAATAPDEERKEPIQI